jgi:putative toxin-antitoxin system antitoxin component (TIGR02293 family)
MRKGQNIKERSVKRVGKKHNDSWRIVGAEGKVGTVQLNISVHHFLGARRGMNSGVPNESEAILKYGEINPIIQYLGYSQQEMAMVLEVDPSTLSRWKKEDKPIGKLRSKTMFDMDYLITKGIRVFGSDKNFKGWLNAINYSLGDKRPIELIKDPFGIELVDNAIEALSWGNVI